MALTDRQIAMLREMGVPAWPSLRAPAATPPAAPVAAPVAAASAVPAAAPVASAATASIAPPVPITAHAPVATLDWDGLRTAVAACQSCALAGSRQRTVFGAGSTQAHWMLVGEAPGEQEDRQGEPFVGAAGQLLDAMLRAAGLTREADSGAEPARQVYITNTLKCRPPRNRNPEPAEMHECAPFLVRQIELLQPRLILAMGGFAVKGLLQTDEAVGRLRGRVHRHRGIPVVVTYHPAYLLRNLPEKARAWEDLCLALQTMESLGPR